MKKNRKKDKKNSVVKNNAPSEFDVQGNIKPEYKKMLNNLLGIGTGDNSVFMSSKVNNFDLAKILSPSDLQKVFTTDSFEVEVKELAFGESMLNLLNDSKNADEFIEIIHDNGFLLTISDRKLLDKKFKDSKPKIIEKIRTSKAQKIAKWKKFKNKYQEKQTQTNSWPLYVGSMILKVATPSSTLYAPLILKKVEIKISNTNKVHITSIDDSVEINEKLLFLLQNEYHFELPPIDENKTYSMSEAISIYSKILEEITESKSVQLGEFKFLNKDQITNDDLQYAPGVMLSMLSPSGGILRDKLIDMIKQNEIESILDVDQMKDVRKEVLEEIEDKNTIYRITMTDFSQEKAIHGALKENAIIWGPPGTGKSQTISNIVANILANNKSAIITSEKKAALDVIQKRMGKLAKYMFFGLTDKDVKTESFYKPFNELVDMMIVTKSVKKKEPATYMTTNEWKYYKQKKALKDENVENLINLNNSLNGRTDLLGELLENKDLILEHQKLIKNEAESVTWEDALKDSKIGKTGFASKKYPKYTVEIKELIDKFGESKEALQLFAKLNNPENARSIKRFVHVEEEYKTDKSKFEDDIDYLDLVLAGRFRERLDKINEDPEMKKKVTAFLKDCKAAFRTPYRFIDIHKDVIVNLFNIFVSTPQTLASVIDMSIEYDYAIFDEASQLHLEKAIPFMSVCKQSIIAGDHQQMRPTSYFEIRDNTEILEDSAANVDSLLDFAYRSGMKAREHMLTKNYRSKSSDLMMFSSKEFYESNLDIIDSKDKVNYQSIEVHEIEGKWEGRVNKKEAEAALDKVLKEKDNFETIILLTLNSSQKQYIESCIYANKKYAEIIELLKDDRVFLRNLENIQGDEADLVIISVAYDKKANLGSTYVAKPEGKNALNVAISRAIEKMIVFKSIKSEEVNLNVTNDSMRVFRDWLSYLESPTLDRKQYVSKTLTTTIDTDTSFEDEVHDEISNNIDLPEKYHIARQYSVGSYSIDIAIINSETKEFEMGVEVDKYKNHTGFEKMTKDIERKRFIEAKGYAPIYRVTEFNWKVNREKTFQDIASLISWNRKWLKDQ